MDETSNSCVTFARRAAQACRRAIKRLDLRGRYDRHQREVRRHLLYGAVSKFGSWGAGILITYLMSR
ncbi:hypothetical protein [Streptomyces sp. t39]|uniref:hypothetical protein n=1 Tax=Streptomyces sp. t39 TaxID=1828156 RepID=UPI0011CDA930|nr:hypothetical protein [Streptomyces sp. t39]